MSWQTDGELPAPEYDDDGIFRDPRPQQITPEAAVAMINEAIQNPYTFREWLGDAAAFVAKRLTPYLNEDADGVPIPDAKYLVPDAPPVARDLIMAWRSCCILDGASHRDGRWVFDMNDLLEAFYLGCAVQRIKVREKAPLARSGKRSREGAAKGLASKRSKAVLRREATQQAVRDRWAKNPKLSLSSIQQALAKLDDAPFGMLRTIEKNTAGMKRPK